MHMLIRRTNQVLHLQLHLQLLTTRTCKTDCTYDSTGAMLTTTATTAFCLLLNAFSGFPMLMAFGVFNM